MGAMLAPAGIAYRHLRRESATLTFNGQPVYFDAAGRASVTLSGQTYVGDLLVRASTAPHRPV